MAAAASTTTPASSHAAQECSRLSVLFSVGLHKVIEQLLAIPELRQLWFLDDGVVRGKASVVHRALSGMTTGLGKINLSTNVRKCEIYLRQATAGRLRQRRCARSRRMVVPGHTTVWTNNKSAGTCSLARSASDIKNDIVRQQPPEAGISSASRHCRSV